MADNKLIAKNTLILYIRMLFIMGVILYTSRVVLDKLGVDDYGLYNVVGGVVMMLSFINGTLSIGTSRFITYELGRKDNVKLSETFNTAFYTHLGLGICLAFLLETIGLWFVYNKLVIPPDRFNAAIVAYHISIFTSLINITQVPYSSVIIAYEKMEIYAYISLFEALARLGIVYLLSLSSVDKLVMYAILMAGVQLLTAFMYRSYCILNYEASRLKLIFNKKIFKSLMSFSGWNIIANLSETLKSQGYIVLINLFFRPAVVTAQTIGNQVGGAMLQFLLNFRTAVNPQIIKMYSVGDYEGSKKLAMNSTILSFDLVLLLCFPLICIMDTIMHIWLVEVPEYAVVFTQLILVQRILGSIDGSFYIPMMASGKIKTNSIYAIIFGPGTFLLLYIIFKLGGDVMWLQYVGILIMIIYSFFIKPSILVKEVEGYCFRDFIPCFLSCIKVFALSGIITYLAYTLIGNMELLPSIILFFISFFSVAFSSYIFLERQLRTKVNKIVLKRFSHAFSR